MVTSSSLEVSPLSRKACMACGCSTVDHAPESDLEDDQRMGRLFGDSPCSHLTTKVKGGGGLRMYKRNRMIVTNPVVSRKDPTFITTTYDWAPAGLNQKLNISDKPSAKHKWRTTDKYNFTRK
ncbi:LIM and cysteine-rich domains protein 1 [Ameca splendens]|uniref:LIM and cysteine-rich domains protein 1 n=1 Tax=Ameca splendens TaxID=208324 RepID=A0ABV0XUG3_9TELE